MLQIISLSLDYHYRCVIGSRRSYIGQAYLCSTGRFGVQNSINFSTRKCIWIYIFGIEALRRKSLFIFWACDPKPKVMGTYWDFYSTVLKKDPYLELRQRLWGPFWITEALF